MKYGIVENHKFILIDEDRQRLENTLPFMPQYSVEQIGTYDEDQIEQGHDGTWYEKGHAPQRPLEEARTEKLAELEAAFNTASHKAHCTSSVGFEIDADEIANRNIEGLVLVMQPEETTLFRAYDNTFHEVTREQLETMRKEIRAAETAEALKIIVVTPGTLEELANSFMNTAAGHTKASIVNG